MQTMNHDSSPESHWLRSMGRRQLFQQAGMGIGGAALAALLDRDAGADSGEDTAERVMQRRGLHFPPKAKNVIYIHLVGAPSHLDLFDFKPELQKRHGQLCPDEMFVGKQLAFIRSQPTLFGTPKDDRFAYSPCGKSGTEYSPLASTADSSEMPTSGCAVTAAVRAILRSSDLVVQPETQITDAIRYTAKIHFPIIGKTFP